MTRAAITKRRSTKRIARYVPNPALDALIAEQTLERAIREIVEQAIDAVADAVSGEKYTPHDVSADDYVVDILAAIKEQRR